MTRCHLSVFQQQQQDEAAQFFKEEVIEGCAVYNVYLKKVRYHTDRDDVSPVVWITGILLAVKTQS